MQAEIKNYRGLASASLDLSKICLVAGTNEAGKTSTAQAVAAALTGDPVPIAGVKKSSAGLLVRSGAASGGIDLTTEHGSTHVVWPTAKVTTEGKAPFASHIAVGLQSVATTATKDLPAMLSEYLKATPIKKDLIKQLESLALPPSALDQLWQMIESQGWDNVHKSTKEKGAILKGQWLGVTGEDWGSKKGESWLPAGWDNSLIGQSEATLKALVTDASDALEAVIATDAVDYSKNEENRLIASQIDVRIADLSEAEAKELDPAMKHQITEVEGFITSINEHVETIKKELSNLPSPNEAFHLPCPACGVPLELEQGKKLCVATVLSEEEKTLRQSNIDAVASKLKSSQDALHKHMAAKAGIETLIKSFDTEKIKTVSEAKRLVEESKKAASKLVEPVERPDTNIIEQHRNAKAEAESRLNAFVAKNNADKVHAAIMKNVELVELLAPDGIRGQVLIKALKGFNERMQPLCQAASWRAVTLTPEFTPEYAGTPYALLSESAKFRVRTILALTMAQMDGSDAVIIDAADILDKGGRNGLFKTVKFVGLPTLICMTMDARELVPNLSKAGIGYSYWIEGGEAVAI